MNLVQITLLMPFPKKLVVTIPGDCPGELPKELRFMSFCPEFHVRIIHGFKVALGPAEEVNHPNFPADRFCIYKLTQYVQGDDFNESLETARTTLEGIVDSLSFQAQEALHPISLELSDVSPSLSLGQVRNSLIVGNGESLLFLKFFMINPPQANPILLPRLDNIDIIENKSDQIVLWWYIKSLSTPFLIEKLSFFMTAIDIMSKPYKVGPYKANCGHELGHCPDCEKSIERPLIGESIKEYLIEHGFTTEEAQKLWHVRQFVHGKDIFSLLTLEESSILVYKLQIITFNYLKSKTKLETLMPTVNLSTVGTTPNLGLTGFKRIDESDIMIASAFEKLSL